MKKKFYYFLFFGIFLTFQLNAQNLIPTWHGNGITGANSEANKWGWSSTVSATWYQAGATWGVD